MEGHEKQQALMSTACRITPNMMKCQTFRRATARLLRALRENVSVHVGIAYFRVRRVVVVQILLAGAGFCLEMVAALLMQGLCSVTS